MEGLFMENSIKEDLKNEMFFADPREEYGYFKDRMAVIENYSNDFFQERAISNLVTRYIRALSCLDDNYDNTVIRDVYIDCLIQLGMDDYCIENEVGDYKLTHSGEKQKKFVSKSSKK